MDSDEVGKELNKSLASGSGGKFARFLLSCVGGALPIFGGVVSGAAGAWSETDQERFNKLFRIWFQIHENELKEIGITLIEVMMRLDAEDEAIKKRIESPEYLSLLRKCFRDWSAAESSEKRTYIRNLLVNAAQPKRITTDDVIKLFIKWIDDYSEAHFAVVKDVFRHSGSTRGEIWVRVHGTQVRDDSAEADLFKLLIHDLSTGRVIRQHRESDGDGRFFKQHTKKPRGPASPYMTSAFEDGKPYELTELGRQFVHFTMNEIVPRLASESPA